jgi:hypothetical protein
MSKEKINIRMTLLQFLICLGLTTVLLIFIYFPFNYHDIDSLDYSYHEVFKCYVKIKSWSVSHLWALIPKNLSEFYYLVAAITGLFFDSPIIGLHIINLMCFILPKACISFAFFVVSLYLFIRYRDLNKIAKSTQIIICLAVVTSLYGSTFLTFPKLIHVNLNQFSKIDGDLANIKSMSDLNSKLIIWHSLNVDNASFITYSSFLNDRSEPFEKTGDGISFDSNNLAKTTDFVIGGGSPVFLQKCETLRSGFFGAFNSKCIDDALRSQRTCEGQDDFSSQSVEDKNQFVDGLSWPEVDGRWTDKRNFFYACTIKNIVPKFIYLDVKPFLHKSLSHQEIYVSINGGDLQRFIVDHPMTIELPLNNYNADSFLLLHIYLPSAARPSDLGINSDQRLLGIEVKSVNFS